MSTDWFKIEHKIREALRDWRYGSINSVSTLIRIDKILGDVTRRGRELDDLSLKELEQNKGGYRKNV